MMAELNASLLCRTCGAPATHAHFIPWIEEPDRVELACEVHEPGGDDGEWYTLSELAQSASGWLRALDRSATPAPDELRRWLEAQLEDAPPHPPTDDAPSSEDRTWLDPEQVAAQVDLAPKTIREKARDGELEGNKVGGRWRFTQAAVDAWVTSGKVPSGRERAPRPTTDDTGPRQRAPKRTFRDMLNS